MRCFVAILGCIGLGACLQERDFTQEFRPTRAEFDIEEDGYISENYSYTDFTDTYDYHSDTALFSQQWSRTWSTGQVDETLTTLNETGFPVFHENFEDGEPSSTVEETWNEKHFEVVSTLTEDADGASRRWDQTLNEAGQVLVEANQTWRSSGVPESEDGLRCLAPENTLKGESIFCITAYEREFDEEGELVQQVEVNFTESGLPDQSYTDEDGDGTWDSTSYFQHTYDTKGRLHEVIESHSDGTKKSFTEATYTEDDLVESIATYRASLNGETWAFENKTIYARYPHPLDGPLGGVLYSRSVNEEDVNHWIYWVMIEWTDEQYVSHWYYQEDHEASWTRSHEVIEF